MQHVRMGVVRGKVEKHKLQYLCAVPVKDHL
jgi:hypothetical protein